MNPLFFGESQRPLFGLYQAPPAGKPRRGALVLSSAIGPEYFPAWPTFRQLGLSFSAAGQHVLRFDYTGMGDSALDSTHCDVSTWVDDLRLAIDELRDLASVPKVSVLGLRLGASIAALCAAAHGPLERVILWEPVVDGATFLDELLELRAEHLRRTLPKPHRAMSEGPAFDVLGFVLSEALTASLKKLDLRALDRRPAEQVVLVLREPNEAAHALSGRLTELGAKVTEHVISSPAIWRKNAGLREARVPADLIRTMVQAASGGDR